MCGTAKWSGTAYNPVHLVNKFSSRAVLSSAFRHWRDGLTRRGDIHLNHYQVRAVLQVQTLDVLVLNGYFII